MTTKEITNEYRITVKCTYSKLNELLESMDEPEVYVYQAEELVNGNFQTIGLDENEAADLNFILSNVTIVDKETE